MQCGDLVAAGLDHVGYAEFFHPCGDRGGTPAAERRHRNSRGHQQLDAVAVAYVKGFQRLAARAEVKAPVGEHAVDVQYQEFYPLERRRFARLQTTPARNRSCTLSAPTTLSSASTTMSDVMR